MSAVTDFADKVVEDEALAAKLSKLTSIDDAIELASQEGFKFTIADVSEATNLTEEALAQASGGFIPLFVMLPKLSQNL